MHADDDRRDGVMPNPSARHANEFRCETADYMISTGRVTTRCPSSSASTRKPSANGSRTAAADSNVGFLIDEYTWYILNRLSYSKNREPPTRSVQIAHKPGLRQQWPDATWHHADSLSHRAGVITHRTIQALDLRNKSRASFALLPEKKIPCRSPLSTGRYYRAWAFS